VTDSEHPNLHEYHPNADEDPLEVLRLCDGFYECPKDNAGRRQGPLVGYAGKYGSDAGERQYIGDVYANFAKLERWPHLVSWLVRERIDGIDDIFADTVCGVPEGGRTLGQEVAKQHRLAFVYPVKSIVKPATATERQVEALRFEREEPSAGSSVLLVEDVLNNMTNTDETIARVEEFGATVVAICCFLNRSKTHDREYEMASGRKIPILYAVRKTFDQYRQDDPSVIKDVADGNLVLKPKKEWARLMTAMMGASAA